MLKTPKAYVIALVCVALPSILFAFCDPPLTPPLTDETTAKLYQDEFRQEFEMYFADAQSYFKCLEDERMRISGEVSDTAQRYNRFLNDSKIWNQEE